MYVLETWDGRIGSTHHIFHGECVFSVPTTLGSGAVKVLVLVGEYFYQEIL